MCGIFGVVGSDNAYAETKDGLQRVAYRGNDSAGIATLYEAQFYIEKVQGHPENLPNIQSNHQIGIGHDRWATHSPPIKENAHPYLSNDCKIALVHNGIIENYPDVKGFLEQKGFNFYSQTDTEVIPNLIQYYLEQNKDILVTIQNLTNDIKGAYAIAFLHIDYPDIIFIARHGSPICIGKGKDKHYISSDIVSLPDDINKVITIDNDQFAIIKKDSVKIKSFKGELQKTKYEKVEKEKNTYNLGGFTSYLEKEIFEQPFYIRNAINGRVNKADYRIRLAGIQDHIECIAAADEVVFVGCGSAFYAAQIAAHAMESIGRVKSRALNAGELQYFNPIITNNTYLVAISQSGETADTIGCINYYKNNGAKTIGIVNVVNSSISRIVDSGIYIRAGFEVSVASTKALTNQILNCLLMAYSIGQKNGLSLYEYETFISDVYGLSASLESILNQSNEIKLITEKYSKSQSLLCIGRGILEVIACETALKIKEISYIHAEGYSAAELKHGPLALICKDMPTIAFVQPGLLGIKTASNIQEIKTRAGPIIAVCSADHYDAIKSEVNDIIKVNAFENEYINMILYLVIGQLFAYYFATSLGRPIDRPRNLSKSLTVE